jgi:hypothetical protein
MTSLLVREQNRWIVHQRPGNRHALLLAARKLAGVMAEPIAQTDAA